MSRRRAVSDQSKNRLAVLLASPEGKVMVEEGLKFSTVRAGALVSSGGFHDPGRWRLQD
jgi:hypothetical protein